MDNKRRKILCQAHTSHIRRLIDIVESHVREYKDIPPGVMTMVRTGNREVFKELRLIDEQLESLE